MYAAIIIYSDLKQDVRKRKLLFNMLKVDCTHTPTVERRVECLKSNISPAKEYLNASMHVPSSVESIM